MECPECGYEGSREEFDRDKIMVYTSPSGMGKMRPCPQCKKHVYFHKVAELEEDEVELKALCLRMDEAVKAGDIDIPRLRGEMVEMVRLNTYLNAKWVDEFLAYINSKIMEARKARKA